MTTLNELPEVEWCGAQVMWTLKDGSRGTGEVIQTFVHRVDRHVLVAVNPIDTAPSAYSREVHPVIFCAATWLTVLG